MRHQDVAGVYKIFPDKACGTFVLTVTLCFLMTLEAIAQTKSESSQSEPSVSLKGLFFSAEHGVSFRHPSTWRMMEAAVKNSVVKIRSDGGKGQEGINLIVTQLDNKREYTIDDFESSALPNLVEILESGRSVVAERPALWRKMIAAAVPLKEYGDQENLLRRPGNAYKISDQITVAYQINLVKDNFLYVLTCSVIANSREMAEDRYEMVRPLFEQIIASVKLEESKYYFAEHGFALTIPDDWMQLGPRPGMLASFGKRGFGQNLAIYQDKLGTNVGIEDVGEEAILGPMYGQVEIFADGVLVVDKISLKYFIYKITDSVLKKKAEGLYDLKYFRIVFIKGGSLYTMIFADSDKNFESHYSEFEETVKSLTSSV
ncbi:MAG: hypothetical protein A2Y02_01900 [Omnitrophica bacterium GWA2_52_12]|nr:MAG: hypothetical protein A2Y02_01900 [Omnitrophica bacterium GWA2_52_12]